MIILAYEKKIIEELQKPSMYKSFTDIFSKYPNWKHYLPLTIKEKNLASAIESITYELIGDQVRSKVNWKKDEYIL